MSQSFNEDPVFRRVKSTLIQGNDMDGLKSTVRTFREFDANHDNQIDPQEWRLGLKKLGVKLTDSEANYLFIAFDTNKDGLVSIDEFVRNLIGQLNPRRTKVVARAFEKFQEQGGPNVTISKRPAEATVGCDTLLSTFTATSRSNPLVQSGTKSEEQLIKEFAMIFDESRNPNGAITKEEFVGYYAAVSTTVGFDDVFESMVLKAWGIDSPTAPRLAATVRDWSSSTATNGKDPLELDGPLLHTQALHSTLGDTRGSKNYNSSHMTRQHPPFVPNPSIVPDYISTTKKDFVAYDEQQRLKADPLSTRRDNGAFEPTATVSRAMAATRGANSSVALTGNPLIDGMRKKILEKVDEEGFVGLRRSFLVMGVGGGSSGGVKVLAKLEARAGLQRFKVSIAPIEFEQLWNYVLRETEAGADGAITINEFIRALRGDSLNDKRLTTVSEAFDHLLKGSGGAGDGRTLSLPALAQLYNTLEHPSVKAGKKTRDAALQDFINSWPSAMNSGRGGGAGIDFHEFIEYYEDVSAGVEEDLAFELLVRNSWKMK